MGTLWPRSGSVEFNNSGAVASGALGYFYEASTTTPRAVYEDSDLTTPHDHPVEADGNGRWPTVFLDFGSYDLKITTAGGTTLSYPQDIPNPEPFDESFSLDETTTLNTGDIFFSLVNSTRTGAVRLNGRTIGSAASSATERANADTADLFAHLWNNLADAQAAVSGGRGGSASSDFAANKRITLPDFRGVGLCGFDDMGNSAASLLGGAPVVTGSTIASGSILGANTHTITEAQLPNHTHSFSATSGNASATHVHNFSTTAGSDGAHVHTVSGGTQGGTGSSAFTGGGVNAPASASAITIDSGGAHTHSVSGTTDTNSATHTHSVSGTTGTGSGSGSAHNNLSRSGLVTWFIKL